VNTEQDPKPSIEREGLKAAKEMSFIDMSTMVEAKPGRGHLHSFHMTITDAATSNFKESFIFGSLNESSSRIRPVFRQKHFERGLATFFHDIHLRDDLVRINSNMDSIKGPKLLHIYEGGFRELTIVSILSEKRDDFIAVFNLFSLDPWLKLLSRRNPFHKLVTRILSRTISRLRSKVAFTLDSVAAVSAFEKETGLKQLRTYPLFSNIGETSVKDGWSERSVDFLFAPRTRAERKLVVQTLKGLSAELPLDRIRKIVIMSRWKSKFRQDELASLDLRSLSVEVINGGLSEDEYQKLFKSTRVVVLPYLDRHYELGSSGKVLDALSANSITVAPAGTSAGKLLQSIDAGFTFNGSPQSLLEALLQIDLEKAPTYVAPQPTVQNSVLEISRLASQLDYSLIGPEKMLAVKSLPLLAAFSAWRWVAIHLVLSPVKTLLTRLRIYL